MADPPVVETGYGQLRGRRDAGVLVFRGVPYARPPVGELRFESPRSAVPWSGLRAADRFAPAAPQQGTEAGLAGKLYRLIRGGVSEDCLYLNVWTGGVDGAARPVLVFLHGGAFILGAGSTFLYDGRRFARLGAVVVTVNYRLGALGFLDLGRLVEDAPPANLGLRDQLAALAWVRENIAAFGGDPENVTVYGESAGAMSAGALLGIERPRDFRRAILSSGAAANVSSPERAEATARRFLDAAGVEPRHWRRLRELSVDRILRAQRSLLRGHLHRMDSLPWQPTVDGDLLVRRPLDAVRDGSAREVDLLIGTNREEWKLFDLLAVHLRWLGASSLRGRVERLLEQARLDPASAEELIAAHLARETRAGRFAAWVSIRTEQFFLLPAVELAEAHARAGGRTRVYRFDLRAPRLPRWVGSCHGIELAPVFGSYRHLLLAWLYGGSSTLRRLSEELAAAWVDFARRGVPAPPDGTDWGCYEPRERATMLFDATSRVIEGPRLAHRRLWGRPSQPE